MATVQNLKKKLKAVRSTQKLSKAMKTAASVKYSRLNERFRGFFDYNNECQALKEFFSKDVASLFRLKEHAPTLFLVLSSNKGLCGNFNSELLSFAAQQLQNNNNYTAVVMGKKALSFFADKKIPFVKALEMDDAPSFERAEQILSFLREFSEQNEICDIKIIYPNYKNMMIQKPKVQSLIFGEQISQDNLPMFFPDKQTAQKALAQKIAVNFLYGCLLETALGAQAATLMTMRSAYDTAGEYCAKLERELNHLRQSRVTADVIETAVQTE